MCILHLKSVIRLPNLLLVGQLLNAIVIRGLSSDKYIVESPVSQERVNTWDHSA